MLEFELEKFLHSSFKFLHTPTFDCRVHKLIKHFYDSFSYYASVLSNSFPFQMRNSPSVATFKDTPQNPQFQFQFPNLVSFLLGHTHNSGSVTLNAPQLSLLKMIFVN